MVTPSPRGVTAGSVIDLLGQGLPADRALVPVSTLLLVLSGGISSCPGSDAELDSMSRVCRFFRNSMMRFTVSSFSPRSRKLLSEMVSVRLDLKGLLVRFARFELLVFFFIGAGLLEDWRNEDVRSGIESAMGLGRGEA
jgi:hypothetical protein